MSIFDYTGTLSAFIPSELLAIIVKGGPIVAALIVLSIAALTVILFKAAQFARLGIGREQKTLALAVEHWRSGNAHDALEVASTQAGRRAQLIQTAMHAGTDPRPMALIREDIEAEARAYLVSLRSHLRVLEAAAQLAPLIGLFGTVIGMMTAFQGLQSAGTEADPAALAGGIWTALITTAVGLAIAIPAALALYWFDGRLASEQALIERSITRVLTAPPVAPSSQSDQRIGIIDAAE
jgi:biopolymer transport protein ExbB